MKDVSVCVAQVKIKQQVFYLASLDMALSKVVTDAIIFQSERQAEKVLGDVERELERRLGECVTGRTVSVNVSFLLR